jgi:hypothetical protein
MLLATRATTLRPKALFLEHRIDARLSARPVISRTTDSNAARLTFRMLKMEFGMNFLAILAAETPTLGRRVARAVDAAGP